MSINVCQLTVQNLLQLMVQKSSGNLYDLNKIKKPALKLRFE